MAPAPTAFPTTNKALAGVDTEIMVFPTSKNAMVIRHPVSGPLLMGGSLWLQDGFTARALTDGAITTNKEAGFRDAAISADVTAPPPHATAVPDNPPEVKVTKRDTSQPADKI